jgi:integrase
MARFLEAAPGIKYKAAFSVAYGAGLRVSEVASGKVSDIDFKTHDIAHRTGQGSQMLCKTFATLCVREIYVAKALLWPAAKPLSVIMMTHKFLAFHRETTHCRLLADLYTRHTSSGRSACDEI